VYDRQVGTLLTNFGLNMGMNGAHFQTVHNDSCRHGLCHVRTAAIFSRLSCARSRCSGTGRWRAQLVSNFCFLIFAQLCAVFLTLVNTLTVRGASMVQNIFTVAKLLALSLIIITGMVLLCIGGRELGIFLGMNLNCCFFRLQATMTHSNSRSKAATFGRAKLRSPSIRACGRTTAGM
jgi:hypothetical protein